jgi:hypothetical protein
LSSDTPTFNSKVVSNGAVEIKQPNLEIPLAVSLPPSKLSMKVLIYIPGIVIGVEEVEESN